MEDDDQGPYFSALETKPLTDFGPGMVKSVEELHSLIYTARSVLIGLKLRDVNATNILTLVDMMIERERSAQ
jgi:hypothetical protein